MKQQRLTPGLFALSTVLLAHCSPNFDDLTRGGAGQGGSSPGGSHSGGSSGKGGAGQAGSAANAGAPESGHAGELNAGAGGEEFAGASGMEGTMSAGAGGTAGKAGTGGTGGTGAGGTGAGGTGGAGGTSGAGAASGNGGTSGTAGTSGGAAPLVDDTCRSPAAGGGGTSGGSGSGGTSGASGNTGSAGASGSGGTSGASGNSGTTGSSGSGGMSGASGSAGAAGGGCVAPIPGNALTLFVFNDASAIHSGTTAVLPPGGFWFAYGEPNGSPALQRSTTDWSATEGHFCPGALTLSANFTVYGQSEKVGALVNFPGIQNWSTPIEYTRMHAWLKVRSPSTCNLNHIASVQIAVNSNNFTAFNAFGPAPSTFADGQWHEVILPLKGATNYSPTMVNQLNMQMVVLGTVPAGTPVPVRTTMFVDDVWLEGP